MFWTVLANKNINKDLSKHLQNLTFYFERICGYQMQLLSICACAFVIMSLFWDVRHLDLRICPDSE